MFCAKKHYTHKFLDCKENSEEEIQIKSGKSGKKGQRPGHNVRQCPASVWFCSCPLFPLSKCDRHLCV